MFMEQLKRIVWGGLGLCRKDHLKSVNDDFIKNAFANFLNYSFLFQIAISFQIILD